MISQAGEDRIDILLVEDNPHDVLFLREALRHCKVLCDLNIVYDGDEAIRYLKREGKHEGRARPDMILLDLNLPRVDGIEVLDKIKNHPELRAIPVVILTSSDREIDVAESYDKHANCYITKPVDVDDFCRVVKSIEDFWFNIVKLPPA